MSRTLKAIFKSLSMVYQPIVRVDSKEILGHEVLVRGKGKWHRPENLFHYSYEKGATVALDMECIRKALQALPKVNRPSLLFVNVEPITLRTAFSRNGQARRLLKRYAPYHHQVVFELTQGMDLKDFEFIKKGIRTLRKFGYRFALDDVADIGAGFLKLISLRPDFIKLDMRLIQGVSKNHLHQAIVRQLTSLGKQRRSLMIAEGVEHKKDLDFIRKVGIRYVQGYYYSKPRKRMQKKITNHKKGKSK